MMGREFFLFTRLFLCGWKVISSLTNKCVARIVRIRPNQPRCVLPKHHSFKLRKFSHLEVKRPIVTQDQIRESNPRPSGQSGFAHSAIHPKNMPQPSPVSPLALQQLSDNHPLKRITDPNRRFLRSTVRIRSKFRPRDAFRKKLLLSTPKPPIS